mgnify:CR=1 FL=1
MDGGAAFFRIDAAVFMALTAVDQTLETKPLT